MFIKGMLYLITLLLLSACAFSVNKVARISGSDSKLDYSYTLIDRRVEEKRGFFMAGQGNVYSCEYGIYPIGDKELVPDRLTYLGNYLEINARQHVMGKKVEVKRFSIYQNKQGTYKKALARTEVVDGLIGDVVRDVATYQGPVLGCEGTETGEYYLDELQQGGNPLVIYLTVQIAAGIYKVRGVYPVTVDVSDEDSWSAFVKAGVDDVLEKVVEKIKNPPRRRRYKK